MIPFYISVRSLSTDSVIGSSDCVVIVTCSLSSYSITLQRGTAWDNYLFSIFWVILGCFEFMALSPSCEEVRHSVLDEYGTQPKKPVDFLWHSFSPCPHQRCGYRGKNDLILNSTRETHLARSQYSNDILAPLWLFDIISQFRLNIFSVLPTYAFKPLDTYRPMW